MQRLDRQLGEYQLLARLAEGGQSEVFLAARSGPHGFFRPVVIKALPEDFKGDSRLEGLFYQEASISSRFSHPNVVTVHDARRADGEHFMVMDYVAGQTVADLAQRAFAKGPGITLDETLVVLADACRGLDYVHSFEDVDCCEYSIVHCDISPQNLMVTYSGVTRVFDFGISQFVGETSDDKSELIGGKFSYMSPEQCREEELGVRSDIFSLGIILYELATATRLFRGTDQDAVVEAITSKPITPPSEKADHLDERFDEVALRALQRDPDDRFHTAGDFQQRLLELLDRRDTDVDAVRQKLGQKVESLFEDERQEVAATIKEARQRLCGEITGCEDDDEPSERELELEEQLDEAEDTIDRLREDARRANRVASELSEEVDELQQHHRRLFTGLCVLSLVALAVASAAYVSERGIPFSDDEATAEERSVSTSPEQ